jgi:diguanylate cyclase (GGDEF)-like protein
VSSGDAETWAVDGSLALDATQAAGPWDETTRLREEVEALRASTRQYRSLALQDPLTGLPNRTLFEDRARHALAGLPRRGGTAAVLFCDLDGFKAVNDDHGHAVGDAALVEIARRLAGSMRASDTVARYGGDEFLVLCPDVAGEAEALETAARLTSVVAGPVAVGDLELEVGVSVGVAVTDDPHVDPAELVRRADGAMYEAKAAGGPPVLATGPIRRRRDPATLVASEQLRRAILEGGLVLHFQPLQELGSGAVVAVEALVRWDHPQEGLLLPSAFVPLADGTGLGGALADWVLADACRRVAAREPLLVNVNLTPRQLAEPDLIDGVARVLDETGLPAGRLQLEVTEAAVAVDVEAAARTLRRLRLLGVRVGLDDFGAGPSSLAHLRRLPLDFLKIDGSLVGRVDHDEDDRALLGALVATGHALRLEVVAEGVETADQLEAVTAAGCDQAQGWHIGRPAPAPAALA